MKSPKILWLVAFLGLVTACGRDSDSTLPAADRLKSVVVIAAADSAAAAIRVDSVAWRPRLLLPSPFDPLAPALEIEGTYTVFFRNAGDAPIEVRYDLHFLDRDGFLIDVFNPFGLPLRLEAQTPVRHGEIFTIRASDERQIGELTTMQVNVRAQSP
jgi:hypothetical protein